MIVLGINSFHADSSAAILVDGKLIAAAEEERFTRVKHWAGFPARSIQFCLESAGVDFSDVDKVAVNQDSKANLSKKVLYSLKNRPTLDFVMSKLQARKDRSGIPELIYEYFPNCSFKGDVVDVEHHVAHLASAFYSSPYSEATCLSVDGFGDFCSSAWGVGKGNTIEVEGRIYFPHSMGIFYQAMTQFLGFPNYGDEYKIMGLAPYGEPQFIEELRDVVLKKAGGQFELNTKYFRHHTDDVAFEWEGGSPRFQNIYTDELSKLLKRTPRAATLDLTQEDKNLARSIQQMYEEVFLHQLEYLQHQHKTDSVVLSGGCAMNSVANGKIIPATKYKNVYVQPAAGDAGGALGAALSVWFDYEPNASRETLASADIGPRFSQVQIEESLKVANLMSHADFTVEFIEDDAELFRRTAGMIADGEVIGWFQSGMEWGPRALGNRSILGDPRRANMKDILNIKIKRRESFRPFAPSMLREYVADWFEVDDDVPFMMKVYPILKTKRDSIPAVTHVDGTGRLQTVTEQHNRRYHGLISAFYEKTGVPMLLNTSFNENEPIVCRPEEAIACFLRTKMDVLVLENWFVSRN